MAARMELNLEMMRAGVMDLMKAELMVTMTVAMTVDYSEQLMVKCLAAMTVEKLVLKDKYSVEPMVQMKER